MTILIHRVTVQKVRKHHGFGSRSRFKLNPDSNLIQHDLDPDPDLIRNRFESRFRSNPGGVTAKNWRKIPSHKITFSLEISSGVIKYMKETIYISKKLVPALDWIMKIFGKRKNSKILLLHVLLRQLFTKIKYLISSYLHTNVTWHRINNIFYIFISESKR